jgi:hypothetical protein
MLANHVSLAAVVASVVTLAAVAPRSASADSGIRIYESPKYDEVTEGETVIEGNPDTAYATASDYSKWTAMFPDIRKVTVTQQHGVDALVSLDYADHRNNLHFHNDPAHRRVWFENTHSTADMWADLTFGPGPRPGTTAVHARVYADVTGAAGLFVTESKLRHGRTDRIAGDLTKIKIYFAVQAAHATVASR